MNSAQNIVQENNIKFSDKYFSSLFNFSAAHSAYLINILQGMHYCAYIDLSARFQQQSGENISDSAFFCNDVAESLNGAGKYKGKLAANNSDATKCGHELHVINKDSWYSFDYLMEHNLDMFKHILLSWHSHCDTYAAAMNAKKQYEKEYFRQQWIQKLIEINTATDEEVPAAKASSARAQRRAAVISTSFDPIQSQKWNDWVRYRDTYLYRNLGILSSQQRPALKQKLKAILSQIPRFTMSEINGAGLERRQAMLYEYCRL